MLIIISPAKTLDFTSGIKLDKNDFTVCDFLPQAQQLVNQLRTLAPPQLASLMKLSDKLAALNVARYDSWSLPFTADNAKPALLVFKGDVYIGLDALSFDTEDFNFAQQHLRILHSRLAVLIYL